MTTKHEALGYSVVGVKAARRNTMVTCALSVLPGRLMTVKRLIRSFFGQEQGPETVDLYVSGLD